MRRALQSTALWLSSECGCSRLWRAAVLDYLRAVMALSTTIRLESQNMIGWDGMYGGSMMWGGGLIWLLVLIVLILAIAALIKYLRS